MRKNQASEPVRLDDDTKDLLTYYTQALRLDKHDLDGCCISQPELFERVSSDLAFRMSFRDRAKRNLADLEASVDVEVRQESAKKLTEREIASMVRVDPRIREANTVLISCNYVVGRLQALKEAFEHRRAMIKELVTLHQLGYWGETSGRADAREASERKADDVRTRQAKGRKPLGERRREYLLDSGVS